VIALNPTTHPHMRSRWAKSVISPSLATDPRGFFALIGELAADLPHGAVLYLMEDVYVYQAHQHRDLLPDNVRFPFMDDEALAASLDKRAMFAAAERAGVPLPWTRYPESPAALAALRDEVPFPCLLKPLVSRFSFGGTGEAAAIELFPRTFGGKCVAAESWEELEAHFARAHALGIPVCVQELLTGPIEDIYGVHLYADANHELLGAVTGRKLRQVPADFGTGTLCEVLRHDDALALTRAFVREARFHGIGGMEFKADPRTGELKLIEINPRGVHWLDVCRIGGVELPYLKYMDLLGMPVRQEQSCFSGRWVDAGGDFKFWQRYKPSLLGLLASWCGASPSIFNPRDPLPGLLRLIPEPMGQAYLGMKHRLAAARDFRPLAVLQKM
jgi:predicted ATP-grasp superfamily ATP-dependent carboligase